MKKLLIILIAFICFNHNAAAKEELYPALLPYHYNELIFQTPTHFGRIDNMEGLEAEADPYFHDRLALWENGKNMSDKPDILTKTTKFYDYDIHDEEKYNLYYYEAIYNDQHYILREDDKEGNYTFSVYEPLISDEVQILKSESNEKLYSKLKPYKSNISVFKYKDWLMRVDNITDKYDSDGVYRFVAWHNKTMDKKPDIVIENGKYKKDWRFRLSADYYVFENDKYRAALEIDLHGPIASKPYTIKLYRIISSEKVNILEN